MYLVSATPPKQLKTCIISQINFEIEMRGIPERYKTEINKLNVGFYLGRKSKSNKKRCLQFAI
jgi:hypothetical protein